MCSIKVSGPAGLINNAMTHVCSQMALFEQELEGVKVYMTHCSSHLRFPFLLYHMGHLNTFKTTGRDKKMQDKSCFQSRRRFVLVPSLPH